jgi:hypothetical protein
VKDDLRAALEAAYARQETDLGIEPLADYRRSLGQLPSDPGDSPLLEHAEESFAFNRTWGADPLWVEFQRTCSIDEYAYSIPRIAKFIGLTPANFNFVGALADVDPILRSYLEWDGGDGLNSLQAEVFATELAARDLLPPYEGYAGYHKLCEALHEEADLLFLRRESSLRRARLLRSHAREIVARWCHARSQEVTRRHGMAFPGRYEDFAGQLGRMVERGLRKYKRTVQNRI